MNDATSNPDDLFNEYKRLLAKHRVGGRLADEAPDGWTIPYDEEGKFNIDQIEEMIRQLENGRSYGSFDTVGTEPRMDWLFRLGTVRSRMGPYLGPMTRQLRNALGRRVADVERGLDRLGRRLSFQCYVDLFPTGDLNAMSMRVPSGALDSAQHRVDKPPLHRTKNSCTIPTDWARSAPIRKTGDSATR